MKRIISFFILLSIDMFIVIDFIEEEAQFIKNYKEIKDYKIESQKIIFKGLMQCLI